MTSPCNSSLACLLLAASASGEPLQEPAPPAAPQVSRELDAAWSELSPARRREAVEWFRLELRYVESFQMGLLRYLLDGQEVDAGTWPAAGVAPCYDPGTHAPGLPIRRRQLAEGSSRLRRAREELLASSGQDPLISAWLYDWSSGELRRASDPDDPDMVYANARLGFPPDLDLAEALLLRRLDDGDEREALRAFGHTYTDRQGNAYPGITLYDAWGSGVTIEMPDVDVLGVVHDLLDDWRTWVSPVPTRKQEPLYEVVAELFIPARRHRSLREALVRSYMRGSGVPEDAWLESLPRLHALWESASSTPDRLLHELPSAADFTSYLEAWAERCEEQPELLERGKLRLQTLDADRERVRAVFLQVLRQLAEVEERPGPVEKS